MRRGLASAVLCAGLLSLLPGCGGGGGGGGGGPTQPPPPTRSIMFTPTTAAGAKSVFLEMGAASNPDRLVLQIRVEEAVAPGVFGLGFDLVFPSGMLDFDPGSPDLGAFLRGGGVDVSVEVDEVEAGRLLVSVTRLGDDTEGVEGSGLVLTLEFATTSSGNGTIEFENALLVDGARANRFDYEFIGGSLTVQK